MAKTIPISVVMPTYNTDIAMLREAVDSILNQTFRDFEFIIIDDGSTNGSDVYLRGIPDDRIRLIRNPQNIGITRSLNIGLKAAKGKYIARMDADDISYDIRLEKQFAFMESHPDTVMCGSSFEEFGSITGVRVPKSLDLDTYRIKSLFYYPGPLHPTMFIRSSVLEEHGISYDESLKYGQDYSLCAELEKWGKVSVLPEVLFRRRLHEARITALYYDTQKKCSMKTQRKLLLGLLNDVSDAELEMHYQYSYEKHFDNFSDFCKCIVWYLRLICANNRVGKYPKLKFLRFTFRLLLLITAQSVSLKTATNIIGKRYARLAKQKSGPKNV